MIGAGEDQSVPTSALPIEEDAPLSIRGGRAAPPWTLPAGFGLPRGRRGPLRRIEHDPLDVPGKAVPRAQ